ncbi:hypothetical protein [Sphingobacterium paludis]|uniref:Uncharacterized protein n=1 Tax=Sphingobacterium paludis TaxID=1476465 RepID=A0A4R7CVK8_9SPHI|nr:hypothetical protein [Sphingobacterium paludis]TDS05968.1 hypothetical protein B0I21_1182 [Sphingobacterium paludis]
MNRELLVKCGDSIEVKYNSLDRPISEYALVGYMEKPIGVAFFQSRNKYCTAAIVLDSDGDLVLLEHYDDWHFCSISEMEELRKIYNWAFPE